MAQAGLTNAAIAVLALAGACTAPPARPPAQTPPTDAAPPAAEAAPAAPPEAPAPQASPAPTLQDACGAGPLQYLVGRPHTEIPPPLTPSHRRVVCSTCAVTRDFVPFRQTITYDSATGLVTAVKCG